MRSIPARRSTPIPELTWILLGFLLGTAAQGLSDVQVSIEPAQPALGEDVVIRLAGMADPSLELESVTLDEGDINLVFEETACPAGSCGQDRPFTWQVQLPGPELPTPLESGLYQLVVWRDTAYSSDDNLLAALEFGVGAFVDHPLHPGLGVTPSSPGDHDLVTLLVPYRRPVCQWDVMPPPRIHRQGHHIDVTLLTRPAALLLRSPIPQDKCVFGGVETEVLSGELGQLDAGTYRVTLWTQRDAGYGDSLPVRVNSADLVVRDDDPIARLQDGKFEAQVRWTDGQGGQGIGRPVAVGSRQTALFSFFDRDNWELMVKVLDGCAINGHYWVFTAASTNAGYELEITPNLGNGMWQRTHPPGLNAPAVSDIMAFPCDPS